jgi:hypothetical protein
MINITLQQFQIRQPNYPESSSTEEYYYNLCNELLKNWEKSGIFEKLPDEIKKRVVLGVVGYYQDVISDAGIWRTFVNRNRLLYNRTLPFYDIDDDYVDYEMNLQDVRFLVWYTISMLYEPMRYIYPLDSQIEELAILFFNILEQHYDTAPEPDGYHPGKELEMTDVNDAETIFKFGHWLFMHSYLMTPAYSLRLAEMLQESGVNNPNDYSLLQQRLEESMRNDPIGPLALYMREWLYLIVDGKLPPIPRSVRKSKEQMAPHPLYSSFIKATDGSVIKFFDSYESLNNFFIDSLGWERKEEHLPHLKGNDDFVLMVNNEKGMLVAKNINRCIAHPLNKSYDKNYAIKHAFELLTHRGCCPVDLLKYLIEGNYLPDAVFPNVHTKYNKENIRLTSENADFIARCYLQQYYRAD